MKRAPMGAASAEKEDTMLTEYGHDMEVADEFFIGASDLIIAVLPHPFHGRLVERALLMVVSTINLEGLRYKLSWRDGAVAFYQPVTPD
jgi:hypothetical protein